ncbi:hypothetical protein BN2497_3789 [Janthinobacterium sp. CG23_2]|nr:hypothetical protein BN2497_3789 [Janthinobacterium sp. CG23_2]CUU28292.1 hypothetical protein BN3177_3789 [Janthinobacterium sp. CG23_2]
MVNKIFEVPLPEAFGPAAISRDRVNTSGSKHQTDGQIFHFFHINVPISFF